MPPAAEARARGDGRTRRARQTQGRGGGGRAAREENDGDGVCGARRRRVAAANRTTTRDAGGRGNGNTRKNERNDGEGARRKRGASRGGASRARVSERLAQLAGSAAKAASGRAANQLRAAALAILASRPLTFSAVHTAVSAGLASAGIAVPHRSVFEDALKKLATYRAPGKYHLLDAAKAEGADLLAAAERDVPDQVTTPPLRFPEPPASGVLVGSPRRVVDEDVVAGLTDDDEELTRTREGLLPAARAAGDAVKDGEWERAAERCVERMRGVCEGARLSKANRYLSSSSRWDITSDTAFREARRVYQEHYATYMAMHAALESNAAEFAARGRAARGPEGVPRATRREVRRHGRGVRRAGTRTERGETRGLGVRGV